MADQALDRINPLLLAREFISPPAQLSCRGHGLQQLASAMRLYNYYNPIINCRVTQATGAGERDAAKEMAAEFAGANQKALDTDKNYATNVAGSWIVD